MAAVKFLLVGNGPYNNRGCEAIVRGTLEILRHSFGENIQAVLATCAHKDSTDTQNSIETDSAITHIPLLPGGRRWSKSWFQYHIKKQLYSTPTPYDILDHFCKDSLCALQIGGDNYTLDYGRPLLHMELDHYLQSKGLPIILWGASVGPFEADPAFAPTMYEHLKILRAIFVRETTSYEYLKLLHIDRNLYKIADPAFAMAPIEVPPKKIGQALPQHFIGLNLSPLMAKYVTDGDINEWVDRSMQIVQTLVNHTQQNVVLIPHTIGDDSDYQFLHKLAKACWKEKIPKVFFLSANLSAAELKWIISRCSVFIGARTHATIAAFSSCVPTLSLAYSRKAQGLNQDIFGSHNYCIEPADISADHIKQKVLFLLKERDAIIKTLRHGMILLHEQTLLSGIILKQLIKST